MPVPIVFRKASNTLISYNFVDLISGGGQAVLYGSSGFSSTGEEQLLNPTTTDSFYQSKETIQDTSNAWVTYADYDYDLPVNGTVTLKGRGICNVLVYVKDVGPGAGTDNRLTITIKKYDGTTETDIGSVITQNLNQTATENYYRLQLPINIASAVTIRKGETLRITVLAEIKSSSAGTARFYHDPQSEIVSFGGVDYSSDLVFYIPLSSASLQ